MKPAYESHIKYGPPEDGLKYNDMKYPPSQPGQEGAMKYGQEEPLEYDMKRFMEPGKYPPQDSALSMKIAPQSGHPGGPPDGQMPKGYPQDLTGLNMKYPPADERPKFAPSPASDSGSAPPSGLPLMPKSHYPDQLSMLRQQYDPSGMMKFDPMGKYQGPHPPFGPPGSQPPSQQGAHPLHGAPPGSQQHPQDLKYLPESMSGMKGSFSADNLMKSSTYSPLADQNPLDVSASSRLAVTPNQDSQGSNSSSQPPMHSSISSPGGPPPGMPAGYPGHPGIVNPGLMPGNHPSMLGSNSSPAPPTSQPSHQPPSSSQSQSGPPGPPSSSHPSQQQPPSAGQPPHMLPNSSLPSHMSSSPYLSSSHRPPVSSESSSRHQQSTATSTAMSTPISSASSHSPAPMRPSEPLHSRDLPPTRASPINSLLQGMPPHGMLSHPLPLHLGHPGMQLPPHHPAHLAGPLGHAGLLPPSLGGPGGPLPLIGGPTPSALGSLMEVAGAGRRSPSVSSGNPQGHHPPTSLHQPSPLAQSPSTPTAPSSLSRSSPSVQQPGGPGFPQSHHHRSSSPATSTSSSLSRASPMHLSHHSAGSSAVAAAAASAERDRQMMRQQSPHMTPPPPSSSASLISSPLSKMYSQSGQRSPPPNHPFRPGASPPVMRHPQMPLPLPMTGPMGGMPGSVMHHSQPYPLVHPSLYNPHHHNPFFAPYPYGPAAYGPGFSYMKPAGSPLDNPMLHGHPTSIPPPRPEDSQIHGNAGDKSKNNSKPPQNSSSSSSSNSKAPGSGGPNSSSSSSQSNSGGPPGGPSPSGGGPPGGPHSGSPFSGAPHHPSPYPPGPHNPFIENQLQVSGKTSHMDALRAHAHAAAGGVGVLGPPPGHPGHHPGHGPPPGHHGGPPGHHPHPNEPVHIETLDIDPDPEPPSPVHDMNRGPSPEAKPDDTECHRSQSAM